jgi:hypothetical protein
MSHVIKNGYGGMREITMTKDGEDEMLAYLNVMASPNGEYVFSMVREGSIWSLLVLLFSDLDFEGDFHYKGTLATYSCKNNEILHHLQALIRSIHKEGELRIDYTGLIEPSKIFSRRSVPLEKGDCVFQILNNYMEKKVDCFVTTMKKEDRKFVEKSLCILDSLEQKVDLFLINDEIDFIEAGRNAGMVGPYERSEGSGEDDYITYLNIHTRGTDIGDIFSEWAALSMSNKPGDRYEYDEPPSREDDPTYSSDKATRFEIIIGVPSVYIAYHYYDDEKIGNCGCHSCRFWQAWCGYWHVEFSGFCNACIEAGYSYCMMNTHEQAMLREIEEDHIMYKFIQKVHMYYKAPFHKCDYIYHGLLHIMASRAGPYMEYVGDEIPISIVTESYGHIPFYRKFAAIPSDATFILVEACRDIVPRNCVINEKMSHGALSIFSIMYDQIKLLPTLAQVDAEFDSFCKYSVIRCSKCICENITLKEAATKGREHACDTAIAWVTDTEMSRAVLFDNSSDKICLRADPIVLRIDEHYEKSSGLIRSFASYFQCSQLVVLAVLESYPKFPQIDKYGVRWGERNEKYLYRYNKTVVGKYSDLETIVDAVSKKAANKAAREFQIRCMFLLANRSGIKVDDKTICPNFPLNDSNNNVFYRRQ